jgi:carbon monoxide dehydrogenase subunit G
MQIESEFTVDAPIDEVWAFLLDVPKIAPCAPGAELTEVVDDHTWKGKLNVKLGPISMSFAGTVVLQERDDAAHRGVLKAEGREQRGKGAATALVTTTLSEGAPGSTKVAILTDLTISGAAAQYGRGMIADISQRMAKDFARCLQESIEADRASATPAPSTTEAMPAPNDPSTPPAPPTVSGGSTSSAVVASPRPVAKPVKGFRLAVWALWRAVVRFFRRLFRRGN